MTIVHVGKEKKERNEKKQKMPRWMKKFRWIHKNTHSYIYAARKKMKENLYVLFVVFYYKAKINENSTHNTQHINRRRLKMKTTRATNTHDLCKIESFLLFHVFNKCSDFAMTMADSITLCVRFKRLNYSIEAWKISTSMHRHTRTLAHS